MIYAIADALTSEQWAAAIEDASTARTSSGGQVVVKWLPPTPATLAPLSAMSHGEAVAAMQAPEWQDGGGNG